MRGIVASVAFRWTLVIAGGFTAMALVLFGFIYWQTALYERERVDAVLRTAAEMLTGAPPAEIATRLESWLAQGPHDERYAALFAVSGAKLTGNIVAAPGSLPADGRVHRAVFKPVERDNDGDEREVVRAIAIRLDDGRLLAVGYDIDELEDVQKVIVRALGLGLLPMVLLSLLAGSILAVRAQRRIASVHEAVGRIMQGQIRERLPVRGTNDDLDRLAAAVNGMLGEIEYLVEEIRGVGDSIAHDLRTPLTRVRTRLERCRDEANTREEFQTAADRAIASVDQALGVVSAVLRIGEIEHGRRRAAFAPVDLAEVLADVAELYEPFAEEKGLVLTLHLTAGGPVTGDRDLLLEAVGNLVDNAIKFAPPGTDVRLCLTGEPDGIRLSVIDQGPGIPVTERARVLQRFYRGEKSRTIAGSGLGLSLVAAVATLHASRLEISGGETGCVVEIMFPTRQDNRPPVMDPALWPRGTGKLLHVAP